MDDLVVVSLGLNRVTVMSLDGQERRELIEGRDFGQTAQPRQRERHLRPPPLNLFFFWLHIKITIAVFCGTFNLLGYNTLRCT